MSADRTGALGQAALANPREFLAQLYGAAVRSASPLRRMAAYLPPPPKGRTLVIGAGKAAGAMAQALESLWPADAPLAGLVVTRYGHTPPRPVGVPQRIDVAEVAHPVPDAAGMAAAQRMLALTAGLTADDLVLCLVSGGGSALLTLPVDGVSLHAKQAINQALLDCGASIAEINVVRKHLSRIKGGQLALACAPAKVVTLAISDVPGDDPATIASGPTVADPSTCADALGIVRRYRIGVPKGVLAQWQHGALETPKPTTPAFNGNAVHLIATAQQALEAAAVRARAAGVTAYILSDQMQGESREVGRVHAALACAVAQKGQPFAKPCVILSGGETTVTLRPGRAGAQPGRGGRAGEFGMGLAVGLQGEPGVYALSADTDGIDGVQDNAGVWVLPDTLLRAQNQDVAVADCLDRNDAYGFFSALDDLFVTGPTYTNVNDFRAILVQ